MPVKFKLDARAHIPEGTVLLFGISYGPGPDDRRAAEPKVYTYVIMRQGGLWYVSGANGKTPQAAGWGAIERWLDRDGRVVHWIKHVTETETLWPETHAQPAGDPAEGEPLNPGGMNLDGSIDGMR
jgi:hypothetical protein